MTATTIASRTTSQTPETHRGSGRGGWPGTASCSPEQVGGGLEFGSHAVLGRREPQLLQPNGRRGRVRDVGYIGQRITPPQPQRLPQPTRGDLRVTVSQCTLPLTGKALEPQGVHGFRAKVQAVTPGHGPQH